VRHHTISVGVGAGNVEGLNATVGTEGVLGLVGVEGVGTEAVVTLDQLELVQWDDEMTILLLHADGAVALDDIEDGRSPHFEPDGAAVAATGVFHDIISSLLHHFDLSA